MKAVVVHESTYGNTHVVADAVGEEQRARGWGADLATTRELREISSSRG